MNKRRRYKAHRARRARKVARRVSDMMKARAPRCRWCGNRMPLVGAPYCADRGYKDACQTEAQAVDVGRANRRFEMAFPRAHRAMLNRGGGPHGSDWP